MDQTDESISGKLYVRDNFNEERMVCFESSFGHVEAKLACKSFGFSNAAILTPAPVHFGLWFSSYTPVTSISCTGAETNVNDCIHSVNHCSDDEQVRLYCYNNNIDGKLF